MSPVVTQITFPSWMPTGATNIGHISFSDHDLDVTRVQFDVADGRYEQVILDVNEMASANMEMTFSLRCTSFAQQITLAATLIDFQGSQSTPHEITFTCGNPAIYNFDAEQNEVNEVDEYIPLNIFVLDDGVSSLAYGAVETTSQGSHLPGLKSSKTFEIK